MFIYKATNTINGKAYIGFTGDIVKRRHNHHSSARCGSDYTFHRAIRKHGEGAFTWEELANCETIVEAGELEKQYIKQYDTFRNGYNSTAGGDKAWEVSDETKQKISEALVGRDAWNKGISLSDEHKESISKAHTGVFKSSEHRSNMSLAKKGKTSNRAMTCMINGVEYESRSEAARQLNTNSYQISKLIKEQQHG